MTTQEMRVEFARIRAAFPKSAWNKFNYMASHFAHEASDGEITEPKHFVRGAETAAWELKNGKGW